MAFIRKRLSSVHRLYGERYSFQVIETYREAGKVKHRVLANLHGCDSIEKALQFTKEQLEDYRRILARGKPEFGWSETRSWLRLSEQEQEQEKSQWRECIASRVAWYEERVALLERALTVVSKNKVVRFS